MCNLDKQTYQHMFCQPSFSFGNRGPNTKSKTFLPQQGISTISTSIRDDFVISWSETNREFFEKFLKSLMVNAHLCRMIVLSGSHGQLGISCTPLFGVPTECKHFTKSLLSANTSNTSFPILVIIFMDATTYAESVS